LIEAEARRGNGCESCPAQEEPRWPVLKPLSARRGLIPTTSLNKPAMRVMTLVLSVLLADYSWGQSQFPHDDVGIFDITENGPALKEEYLAGVSALEKNYYVRAVNDQYLAIFDRLLKAPGAHTGP
jgi:hypothetical protein